MAEENEDTGQGMSLVAPALAVAIAAGVVIAGAWYLRSGGVIGGLTSGLGGWKPGSIITKIGESAGVHPFEFSPPW